MTRHFTRRFAYYLFKPIGKRVPIENILDQKYYAKQKIIHPQDSLLERLQAGQRQKAIQQGKLQKEVTKSNAQEENSR